MLIYWVYFILFYVTIGLIFLFDKVLQTVEKFNMLQPNDRVIVGVSGGADSVCLLHILKRLSYKFNLDINVVHINHCIRGEMADEDENYVKDLCNGLGVKFFSFRVDVKKEAKRLSLTEEEAGRFYRYKYFNEVCGDNGKIAVAHNKNDNAETIIMRFIRGTGIKGLCGISPVRKNIIRPIIDCERFEIETYCKYNKLEFKTDITNTIYVYTRNKIRLKLIPWISENMNKNIIPSLVKNATIISEEEKYLEEVSENAFYDCVLNDDFSEKVVIDTEKLSKLHDVIKRRVIRKACRYYSKDLHDISYLHINNVIDLAKKETGKFLELPSSVFVQKKYGNLIISKNNKKNVFCLKEPLFFNHKLMYNVLIKIDEISELVVLSKKDYSEFSQEKPHLSISLDKDKINGSLKIRSRLDGDKIFVNGTGNKKLKKLFSERKISQAQRNFIPIIADDENVICAVGVKVSDLYKVGKDTKEKINIYFWRI